jgi:formate dehydrogenase maturation protein FdhE
MSRAFSFSMEDVKCLRCGTVNDYHTEESGPHLKAICNQCNQYIKFVSQGKEPTLYFGKFKDRTIASLISEDEIKYLKWLLGTNIKQKLKDQIEVHLTRVSNG